MSKTFVRYIKHIFLILTRKKGARMVSHLDLRFVDLEGTSGPRFLLDRDPRVSSTG